MKKQLTVLLAGVLLAALVVAMFAGLRPAAAAPGEQIIQPMTGPVLNFATRKVLTSTVWYSQQAQWGTMKTAETQYTVDQTIVAAAANTVTFSLQRSNDGVNWVDYTLVNANVADANAFTTTVTEGKFVRLKITPTNANPVTVTVNTLLK